MFILTKLSHSLGSRANEAVSIKNSGTLVVCYLIVGNQPFLAIFIRSPTNRRSLHAHASGDRMSS